MPKTRKKRGSKTLKTKNSSTNQALEEPIDNTEITNENEISSLADKEQTDEADVSGLSEPELKSELQVELKRLQDEYHRQKEITLELEKEREKFQASSEHDANIISV